MNMASADNAVLVKIKDWGVRHSNTVIIKDDRTFQIYETTSYTACKKGTIDTVNFKEINELLNSKEVTSYTFTSKNEGDQCDGGVKFKIYLEGKEYIHTFPCADSLKQNEILLLFKLKQIRKSVKAAVKTALEYCQDGYYVKLIEKGPTAKNCKDTSINIHIEEIYKIPGVHEDLRKALKSFSLFFIGDNKELEKAIIKKRIIENDTCFYAYLYKSENSVLEYVSYIKNIPPNRDCGASDSLKFSLSMKESERKNWDKLLKCKGAKMSSWFTNRVDIPYSALIRRITKNLETSEDEERMKFYLSLEGKTFNEIYPMLIKDDEASTKMQRKALELKIKKEVEAGSSAGPE
jgi:hypothetical protein